MGYLYGVPLWAPLRVPVGVPLKDLLGSIIGFL